MRIDEWVDSQVQMHVITDFSGERRKLKYAARVDVRSNLPDTLFPLLASIPCRCRIHTRSYLHILCVLGDGFDCKRALR